MAQEKKSLRSHPNHRERGPAKNYYTYQDVADILGVRVESVRRWNSQGVLDIKDFESVVKFIAKKLYDG